MFSGGKDSGLATLMLEPFFDEIDLITFSFGSDDAWKAAAVAAAALGHPHRAMSFDEDVLEKALEMLTSSGFPNDALNYIHALALEDLAGEYPFVADGTRRDDRAPKMSPSAVKSLEDRSGVQYLRPVAGLGNRAIKMMASRYLDFEERPSEEFPASDFEVGLRRALDKRGGQGLVERIFPPRHTHTIVIRRKRVVQEAQGQENKACQGI